MELNQRFAPRQIGLADLDARSAPRRGDERSEESTAQRDDRPKAHLLTPTNDINYLTRVSESEIQFSIP